MKRIIAMAALAVLQFVGMPDAYLAPQLSAPANVARLSRAFALWMLHPVWESYRLFAFRHGLMCASFFVKEERVQFEDLLEEFDDQLVLSSAVSVYPTNQMEMERSVDIIWRPMPYISVSFAGMDQSANFGAYTQLAVPASINIQRSVPWQMTATELRDKLQEKRLFSAAKQKLGSDINVALNSVAANLGSIVVKRTVAATGFDDLAQCDAAYNEQGVNKEERHIGLSTRDYNGMASNLAGRATMAGKPTTAYERANVGQYIAGFDGIYKMDYAPRLTAAAGVTVTISLANQFYVPTRGTTDVNGGVVNTDNRFQTISIAVTSGTVKVGDAFTLAAVNSVHHISKQDTGQLKTFRITAIVTGAGGTGTVQITPPIISAQGGSLAELSYQNVTATPANGSPVTFLNTVSAPVNPFWVRDALEVLPSTIAFQDGVGVGVMRGTTEQGFEVVAMKWQDIKTGNIFYRVDTRFGVANKQPEMTGIMLFNQT